jgi:hypothetical protein
MKQIKNGAGVWFQLLSRSTRPLHPQNNDPERARAAVE